MNYPSIRIEGAILSPDILERLDDAPGRQAADFGFDRNARVKDEIARAWADAQDYWRIPVADGGDQAREVVDGPDEDHAHADPEQAGQPAELLAGQDGPRHRSRGGDGAEVLAEQVEGPRGHEVHAVLS